MTARSVPTMPTWASGQRVLAVSLQQITTYNQFWTSPPSFRMWQAVAQSFATGTWTQFTCDTATGDAYDSDGGRAAGTPWSFTIPSTQGGRWTFGIKGSWTANVTGVRALALYKNGVEVQNSQVNYQSVAQAAISSGIAGPPTTITVSGGDVMSMWGYQGSGGALNSDTTSPAVFEGRLVSLASP